MEEGGLPYTSPRLRLCCCSAGKLANNRSDGNITQGVPVRSPARLFTAKAGGTQGGYVPIQGRSSSWGEKQEQLGQGLQGAQPAKGTWKEFGFQCSTEENGITR